MKTWLWIAFVVILGLGFSGRTDAETSFWLRNTDASSFLWWPVPSGPRDATVLGQLPGVPGGPQTVAPGERVRITLADGHDLVAAFVPWAASPGFLTPVSGGFLLATEAPPKGTLLVDASSFAAANRGRAITAPLQAWGLVPATVVLGGPGWTAVPRVFAWGPTFAPGGTPWPPGWPRVQGLQVADRDGALWVALTADRPWSALPPGVAVSLAFRRPGAFLEWPLAGDPTAWLWTEGNPAQAVGRVARAGAVVQGWIPWNRLASDQALAWHRSTGRWALVISRGDEITVADLGSLGLGELP